MDWRPWLRRPSVAPTGVTPLTYRRVLSMSGRALEVSLREHGGRLRVESSARPGKRAAAEIERAVRRMFRLDEDLSPFYRAVAGDPQMAWAATGAGRILASPTIFEDVIKTICTTNCAWSGTVRMTRALADLGGGAFPEPQLLANTPVSWFRDVARMGYRGPYARDIARAVDREDLDLAQLRAGSGKSDAQVEAMLLELPGVGPYAAAHIMMLTGRHRRLVLDSWTRPTYLRLAKKKRARDISIARAFARYGDYAGLAFWLFVTRDWVEESDAGKTLATAQGPA